MERLFPVIQFVTVALFFLAGAVLYRMGKDDILLDTRSPEIIHTSFIMDEPKPEPKRKEEAPKPKPVEKKPVAEAVPIDLTEKKPEPEKEEEKAEEKQPEPPPVQPPPRQARQVYGLQKVFSQGLGAGGDASDAIIGKRGNTVNKDYDTLTATSDDFKGAPGQGRGGAAPVSSAASVTQFPRLKAGFRSRKPQYSQEMLQNRIEGVVRARILIDGDGKVIKVEIQSDIGYDSAEIAERFLMTLEFEPAMKGDVAVSVWIPFSIRFELI